MEDLLKELSTDPEIKILFNNKRAYLPEAAYIDRTNIGWYEGDNVKEINITGNAPSLVRLGIAHLICHELAHAEHKRLYDDMGDDYSPIFKMIEASMIERIWNLCLKEHEE